MMREDGSDIQGTEGIGAQYLNLLANSVDGPAMSRTRGLSLLALSVGVVAGGTRRVQAAPPPAAATAVAAPAAGTEPAITTPGPQGDYLRRVHERLHGRWTENFVRVVAATYPPTHALNNPSRETTIALTIRWDGTIAEVVLKKPSGTPEFDRAAIDVARKSAPFPLPPQDVVSDDSYTHVEWTFARDHRACGAGAVLARADDPLEVSLPRLVQLNRMGEALRRVGDALKGGNQAGLDRFARLYLGRTSMDPVLNVAGWAALAEAGDQAQASHLREALASRPTMEMAVRGLRKLGVDICEATRATLTSGKAAARDAAVSAVRFAHREGADIGGCLPALTATVADTAQPSAVRLLALDTIITLLPGAARPVVMDRLEDRDPAVRGVALLASVRKGAGRPEMYRLAPLLHDKSVEVRAAASAGIVRAAGDMALDQLYLLARETDPRPAAAVAAELAQMNSRASAEFLGKMVRRNLVPVQLAAAKALAARKDAGARAELESAKTDAHLPSDVQAVVLARGKPDTKASAPVTAPVESAASEPVRAMLKENHNAEAATWIVEKLTTLEPREAIAVLGAWLVRGPAAAVQAPAPAAPSAAPAAAAPEATAPEGAQQATSAL